MTTLDKWTDFFRKAGLPKEVSNTYAHSFTENRIQMSMLPDLNKEYLREMGIFRMGDIILILRQAKSVQERGTEDRGVVSVKRKISDDSEDDQPVIKRNVSMTTTSKMRSDIKPIVRKSILTEESDEEPVTIKKKLAKEPQKTMVVLNKNSINDREVPQRLSSSTKSIKRTIDTKNSSIFDRLGSKSAEISTVKTSPIVTASQTKNQRVLLVKKVPAKAVYASSNESDMTEDDDDEYMNVTTSEKSVSFSAQDEIIEIASHKKGILKQRQRLQQQQKISQKPLSQNVKARLGLKSPVKNTSQAFAKLRLQQSPRVGGGGIVTKITSNNTKPKVISSLKSDEILRQQMKNKSQSVHDRLFNAKQQDKKSGGLGVGRKVQLKTRVEVKNGSSTTTTKTQNSGKSVFDRLGFNKRK